MSIASSQWVEWAVRRADSLEAGRVKVTPQAHSLSVRWPGGGIVWNHPAAVFVERDGITARVPVVDVVWMARLALLALAGIWILGLAVWSIRARRNWHE